MSALREAIEHATLGWIKPELDSALKQVQADVGAYAEAPVDAGLMHGVATQLRQVEGTLRMLELYAPAMVTEEMQHLATAVADGSLGGQTEEACEALLRATVQLPDYLERLQSGHRDIPVVLLPLLNDLRTLRGEHPLGEGVLFSPDFDRPLPAEVPRADSLVAAAGMATAEPLMAELRRTLDRWQSEGTVDARALKSTLDGLLSLAQDDDVRRMLWVGAESADALDAGALRSSRPLRDAYATIEQETRNALHADGLRAGATSALYHPVRQLLQQVANSRAEHPALDRLRQAFGLGEPQVTESERQHAQGSVTGLNRALLDTVASALKEDVFRVKDALDLHLRTGSTDSAGLLPEVEALERIGDTLGMLGLGSARDMIRSQRDSLAGIVAGRVPVTEQSLLDIAGALLFVDASLEDQVARMGQESGGPASSEDSLRASDAQQLLQVLTREAVANFSDARQAFVGFVETGWDHAQLAEVPRLLDEVGGALGMLELPVAADHLKGIRLFTERELIHKKRVPGSQMLDTLADALASVEYYLEALRDKRADREDILAITRQSLEALHYWPLPMDTAPDEPSPVDAEMEDAYETFIVNAADEQANEAAEAQTAVLAPEPAAESGRAPVDVVEPILAAAPVPALSAAGTLGTAALRPDYAFDMGKDDIDDEIREIFVEEFDEEIRNLDGLVPAWKANPSDNERLRPIRRVFHTLKGSGRLVGATALGEYSWKIENMLNRVLDGTRPATPAVIGLVDTAVAQLPHLHAALQHQPVPQLDLAGIGEVADRLATGEETVYIAPPAVEATEPEAREEVVAAPTATPASTPTVAVSVDAILLEILASEVGGHMDTVEQWLERARDGTLPPDDNVLRAIHTMNGAFAMAEVPEITDATGPAEGYIKRLRAHGTAPDAAGVEALAELARQIHGTVTALHASPQLVAVQADLASRLVALRDALPPEPSHSFDQDEANAADITALELERIAAEQAELDRVAAEQAEAERLAAEHAEAERLAAEHAEAERLAAEQAEAERLAAEQAEAERLAAEHAEAERVAAEQAEAERLAAEHAEAERVAAEQAEAERLAAEHAEAERAAAEQAEAERLAAEHAEAERLAAEQAEAERVAAEHAEAERVAAEHAEAERLAAEQAEAERIAAEEQAEYARLEEEYAEQARAAQAALAAASGPAPIAEPAFVEPSTVAPEPVEPVAAPLAAGAGEVDLGPATPLPTEHLDLELLDIFVEESHDLLDHSDSLLANLRQIPDDASTITALQRDLHTLKGGARMAGIMSIGDLGHSMESLLEAVAEHRTELGQDGVPLLERGLDTLRAMSERVASRQASSTPTELVATFNARARGVVATPARAAVVEANAPMAELSAPVETALDRASQDQQLVRGAQEQVRIRADLLDRLVNYAGEVAIYRARLEQQLGAFRSAMGEMEQTNLRLRDQLRRLDIETEAQIVARYQREQEAEQIFDPLELDRFSTLQQLTRALNESANDMSALQGSLEDLTRQYETLLLQQSRVSTDLQEGLMRTRMMPFDTVLPRLRRVIRQATSETGKEAQLAANGAQNELDRNVLDRMTAPLEHLLRNAVAHGIESPEKRRAKGKDSEGRIRLDVRHEGSEVVLSIQDDGAGLDYAAIRRRGEERGLVAPGAELTNTDLAALILQPGFSTASEVSQLAGRGVGMDVVDSEVRQLGGTLDISSEPGKGTLFTLRLPQTLAVTQAVFVRIGETTFAVPIASVQGVSRMARVEYAPGVAIHAYGGEDYVVHDLGLLLGQPPVHADEQLQIPLLLIRAGELRVAVGVDQILGNREIVVKPVGPQVASIPGIFGATVMGDGSVVVILDLAPLARRYTTQPQVHEEEAPQAVEALASHVVPVVMVVDDSVTMRKVTGRVLERQGYEVMTAKDGVDALERMAERVPDLMLLDIEMPRMDGYELATAMRRDSRLRGVPIIMITSRTGEKHRQRAFDIGVNRYLGKPYQEPELLRNVTDLLSLTHD